MFREMRRKNQALSEEEIIKILENGKRGVLALHGENDYPYGVPVNYFFDKENRKLYFHGAGEGHKIDSIKRNNKASYTILEQGEKETWWFHYRSAILFGHIRIIEDAKEKEDYIRRLGNKYYPDPEEVEKIIKGYLAHTTILEFTIDHMTGKKITEK